MPSHTGSDLASKRLRNLCYLPLLLIFALHAPSFLHCIHFFLGLCSSPCSLHLYLRKLYCISTPIDSVQRVRRDQVVVVVVHKAIASPIRPKPGPRTSGTLSDAKFALYCKQPRMLHRSTAVHRASQLRNEAMSMSSAIDSNRD